MSFPVNSCCLKLNAKGFSSSAQDGALGQVVLSSVPTPSSRESIALGRGALSSVPTPSFRESIAFGRVAQPVGGRRYVPPGPKRDVLTRERLAEELATICTPWSAGFQVRQKRRGQRTRDLDADQIAAAQAEYDAWMEKHHDMVLDELEGLPSSWMQHTVLALFTEIFYAHNDPNPKTEPHLDSIFAQQVALQALSGLAKYRQIKPEHGSCADLMVDGRIAEVKMATRWRNWRGKWHPREVKCGTGHGVKNFIAKHGLLVVVERGNYNNIIWTFSASSCTHNERERTITLPADYYYRGGFVDRIETPRQRGAIPHVRAVIEKICDSGEILIPPECFEDLARVWREYQ